MVIVSTQDETSVSSFEGCSVASSSQQQAQRKGQCCHSLRTLCHGITVEPTILLFSMGDSIMGTIVQTFYIDKICRITEGLSPEICQNLTAYPSEEKLVETVASEFTMYQTVISAAFPVLLSIYVGPLTDQYGYKPLILYSTMGYVLLALAMLIILFVPWLPPAYLLVPYIFVGLSGGMTTFSISTFGYLAKKSTVETRSFRLAITSAIWDFGTVIGFICGTKIFEMGSFQAAFIYSCVHYAAAFLFILIRLEKEKVETNELLGRVDGGSFQSVFSAEPLREMVSTCFKRRPDNKRMLIMMVTMASCLYYFSWTSKSSMMYLYTRNKLSWDEEHFSFYTAASTLMSAVGSSVLTFLFLKALKVRDSVVVIVTTISNLSACIVYSLATSEGQMYLGSGIQMFGMITTNVFKSILYKCVQPDEYGKLLSFVICMEMLAPLVAAPLYTVVYVQTVISFPGAIFVVAAILNMVLLVLCGLIHVFTTRMEEYTLIVNESG